MKDKAILAEKYAEGKSSSSVFREAHIRDFLAGFNSAEKENEVNLKKQIKDLKNKYSSHLVEHQLPKLGKIINQEEVLKLKSKLEVLTELEKKLGICG
jgi:hypothetical protein